MEITTIAAISLKIHKNEKSRRNGLAAQPDFNIPPQARGFTFIAGKPRLDATGGSTSNVSYSSPTLPYPNHA